MTFRVKIISPLKASEADLARRQQRYGEVTQPDTKIVVENLPGGPAALNTSGDLLLSAAAIFKQGLKTKPEAFHAILIDCVFDPAVEELREATSVPIFGPTQVTLPLIPLVSPNFSVIARTERQCQLLVDTVNGYGYDNHICSSRALGISYEEAKAPEIFERVMAEKVEEAVGQDGARAIMFGSTTMEITDEIRTRAKGVPLFMPGMVAIQVMEQLWNGHVWPG